MRSSDRMRIFRKICYTMARNPSAGTGYELLRDIIVKRPRKGRPRRGSVRASVNGRHLSCHVATASVSHPAICWYTRWRRSCFQRRRAGFPGSDCVTASRKPAEWLSLHGPNPSNCCQSAGCYIFSPATATEGAEPHTHSSCEKMRDEMSEELRRTE